MPQMKVQTIFTLGTSYDYFFKFTTPITWRDLLNICLLKV